MRRVKLGSEWQRIQTKMKQIKLKSKQCNKYLASKDSAEKRNNARILDVDDEKEAIAALSTSLQESVVQALEETNDNDENSCTVRKRKNLNRKINNLITFNDEALKSFYQTLMHYNNNLFKTMCWCNSSESINYKDSGSLAAKKSCIFCHLFRSYEENRINNEKISNKLNILNSQVDDKDVVVSPPPSPASSRDDKVLKANENIVKIDHSYCKQPSFKSKSSFINSSPSHLLTCVDEIEDDLLDEIINKRFNKLFDSKKFRIDNYNNSNAVSNNLGSNNTTTNYKSIFDDDFELDLKQSNMNLIDELSPSDLKKLPNLSYE